MDSHFQLINAVEHFHLSKSENILYLKLDFATKTKSIWIVQGHGVDCMFETEGPSK